MPSLNQCHFIGNLTRDPETTQTPTGKTKADLTLAINDRVANTERTTYLYFTAWESTATFCANHLRKGSLVHIEARATQDVWTDKSGRNQRKTYFLVNRIQPIGPAPQATQQTTQQRQHQQAKQNAYQPQPMPHENDDDCPF